MMESIVKSVKHAIAWEDARNVLIAGESLQIIRQFPERSVDLIVTDPPYHSTKKSNIIGDTAFEDDEAYLKWMDQFAAEWTRILKPTGSLYCFCSNRMSARLEVLLRARMTVLSNITWTKPNLPGFDGWKQKTNKASLRQWYDQSEHVIFAVPSFPGNLFNSYFGNKLREWRIAAKMSMKDLAELTKAYGKVNHGGAVANWEAGRNIPSETQYAELVKALAPYMSEPAPDYCDIIRPFHVSDEVEFTDVWNYPTVRPYKGKHPAEKPINMLEDIIRASSNEGNVVLDCFSGSGSTAVAALKCKRLAISIDIDEKWIDSCKRKFDLIASLHYRTFPDNSTAMPKQKKPSLSYVGSLA